MLYVIDERRNVRQICIDNHKKQQDYISPTKEKTSNNEHHDIVEVVNPSNVSPNTPKADEADIL
jgi:hypothetical protein